jgi:tape measure domain-containing protein
MSERISYVLQVLDGYSKHTKKFKTEVRSLNTLFRRLDKQILKTSSSFSRLASLSRLNRTSVQTNNLARSIDRVNQANVRSIAISKRAGKRTFAGAYTPVKFDPYAGKYVGKFQKPPSAVGYGMAGAMGGMSSVRGVAASMGVMGGAYTAGRTAMKVRELAIDLQGYKASLDVLLPKTKGMEGETADSQVKYLRDISNKIGVRFADIQEPYRNMLATGVADKDLAQGLTEFVSGYGRLIHMSSPALKDTMRGFEQMLTKGRIQAQEFNLQTQQMPGVKQVFYEAFKRIANRAGISEINESNKEAMFIDAMSKGVLKSADILEEFYKVGKEDFWVGIMKKASTAKAEENRLINHLNILGSNIGMKALPSYTDLIVGLAGVVESINSFGDDIGTIRAFFSEKREKNKPWQDKLRKENPDPYGFTPVGRGILETSSQIVKLPLNTAYEATMGMMTGDWSNIGEPAQEFNKFGASIFDGSVNALAGLFDKSFGDPLNRLINILIQKETNQQKIEVEITGNLPDMFSAKQNMSTWNRPQTVIAGTR